MNRVLVAENDPGVAAELDRCLRHAGFGPIVVGDPRDAVAVALRGRCNLVLLGPGLHSASGTAVLRQISAAGGTVRTIVLSDTDDVAALVEAFEAGAADYLRTPCRLDELLARIRLRLRGVGAATPADLARV
ncbi:MAG: response regulator transcription factor [Pseudonocardia sp.]